MRLLLLGSGLETAAVGAIELRILLLAETGTAASSSLAGATAQVDTVTPLTASAAGHGNSGRIVGLDCGVGGTGNRRV